MRFVLLVALAATLAGCAVAPPQYTFDKSWSIEHDYDKVWAAIIDILAEHNIPIQTIEKDSGLLVTEWISLGFPAKWMDTIVDCGTAGILTVGNRSLRFNMVLREQGESSRLTINCNFMEFRSYGNQGGNTPCSSRGTMELRLKRNIEDTVTGHALTQPFYPQ